MTRDDIDAEENTQPSADDENADAVDETVEHIDPDERVGGVDHLTAGESAGDVQEIRRLLEDLSEQLSLLTGRVEHLERRLEESQPAASSVSADLELTHKIIHACLQSEQISDEEELQILQELIGTEPN